jgi:hypothetical protein
MLRVTEILDRARLRPDFSRVDPSVLAHASMRGKAVHRAIELHEANDLDETSLHPEVRPYFDAYLRFREETEHEPIASEIPLVHPVWGYVGHPDRVGWLRGGRRVCLDWKAVASLDVDYVNFQVRGGYRLAWNALHPTEPIDECFAVQFLPDGKYNLQPLVRADAEQVFLAALIVAREQKRREGKNGGGSSESIAV